MVPRMTFPANPLGGWTKMSNVQPRRVSNSKRALTKAILKSRLPASISTTNNPTFMMRGQDRSQASKMSNFVQPWTDNG